MSNLVSGNGFNRTYRKKSDGFLHLNNYSHSMRSGMAGVIYERLLTKNQQDNVQEFLFDLAEAEQLNFKHNVWRFDIDFLNKEFKRIVYGYLQLVRKQSSVLFSMAATKEIMDLEDPLPKLRFK